MGKRGRPKGSKNKLSDKLLDQRKEDLEKEEVHPLAMKNQEQISKEQQNKREKLRKTMAEINREFDDSSMCKFANEELPKESLPIGIKEIDELLGGGAVIGNFVIFWGGEGVGKTTLMFHQIAESQKQGKICAYIDIEHTLDKDRMKIFGINLEDLLLIENCETAEQAMDITIKLTKEKAVDLIVIDSIQAMSPKDEQYEKGSKERSMEKDEMALLARKMGKFLRRTSSYVYKGKVAVVLIGQTRTGGIGSFIVREELTGGHAIKHFSMLTVHLRKGQSADAPTKKEKVEKITINEEGDEVSQVKTQEVKMGFDVVLKIEKTKKSTSKPELSELHLPFYYKSGFRKEE